MPFLVRQFMRIRTFFAGKARLRVGLALLGIGLAALAVPRGASACSWYDVPCHAAHFFVFIFELLTALMGFLLILEVDALLHVAQYFNFVSPGPTAVRLGWIVTRDLSNMFFIVFLLIIAFSTVIGYAKYHYEKNLATLLIMAIVINFSKTLCGLMIDASQVLMLSFVNGFKAAAAGNFMNAFGINKLLAIAEVDGDYNFKLVLAMMFAFILASIAAAVVLVMLVMICFRVIMLWILIILSPIAFLTRAFPLSGNYYAMWWGELKKYLVGGPVIAFFLWLTLASAQGAAQNGGSLANESNPQTGQNYWGPKTTAASIEAAQGTARVGGQQVGIPTEAGSTSDTILSMIIAICLLFAGLKFASKEEIGGMGAGFASKVNNKVKGALRRAAMAPVGVAGFAAGAAAGRAKQGAFGVLGSLATRVPGLRGIGAAALAREEDIKKKRRASLERFTGTEEQKSRFLPGGAYASRVAGMDDPKRQLEAFKLGLANPKTREALFAPGKDGGYSQAALALKNMNVNGKDKDFMEMADLAMSDKNFNKALKDDPELLAATRERMQEIAFGKMGADGKRSGGDANQAKKAGEFDQKFVAQLADAPVRDKSGALVYEKDAKGELIRDANGQPVTKKHFTEEKLKELIPKIPIDDIGGLDAKALKLATAYMTESQFNKASESTAGNAVKYDALKEGTRNALEAAVASKDISKIADAAKRAIHSDELGAAEISKDDVLRDALAKRGDVGNLVNNMDRSSEGQREAVKEVMSAIMKADPERARNMSKQERYQEFMPSKEDIAKYQESVRGSQRNALVGEAEGLIKDMRKQLESVSQLEESPSEARVAEEKAQLEIINKLESLMKERSGPAQEITRLEEARSRGGDANTIAGLERSISGLKDTLKKLDNDIAKQVAATKGQTFNSGEAQGRKNRGNRP